MFGCAKKTDSLTRWKRQAATASKIQKNMCRRRVAAPTEAAYGSEGVSPATVLAARERHAAALRIQGEASAWEWYMQCGAWSSASSARPSSLAAASGYLEHTQFCLWVSHNVLRKSSLICVCRRTRQTLFSQLLPRMLRRNQTAWFLGLKCFSHSIRQPTLGTTLRIAKQPLRNTPLRDVSNQQLVRCRRETVRLRGAVYCRRRWWRY